MGFVQSSQKAQSRLQWNQLWLHTAVVACFVLSLSWFKQNADFPAGIEASVQKQYQKNIQIQIGATQYTADTLLNFDQLSLWLQQALPIRLLDAQNTAFISTIGQLSPPSTSRWAGTKLSLSEPAGPWTNLATTNDQVVNSRDYQYKNCSSTKTNGVAPIKTGVFSSESSVCTNYLCGAAATIIMTNQTSNPNIFNFIFTVSLSQNYLLFSGARCTLDSVARTAFCPAFDAQTNYYYNASLIFSQDGNQFEMGYFDYRGTQSYTVFSFKDFPMCPTTWFSVEAQDLLNLIIKCRNPVSYVTPTKYFLRPNNYDFVDIGNPSEIVSAMFKDNAIIGNFTSSVWLNSWVFNSAYSAVSFVLMQWGVDKAGKMNFNMEVSTVLICGVPAKWQAGILLMLFISLVLNMVAVAISWIMFRRHFLFRRILPKTFVEMNILNNAKIPSAFQVFIETGQMIILCVFISYMYQNLKSQAFSNLCTLPQSTCSSADLDTRYAQLLAVLANGETLLTTRITVLFMGVFIVLLMTLRLITFIPAKSYLFLIPRLLIISVQDLFHFGIIFGIIMVGYAIAGFALYTNILPDFITIESSLQRLLNMLISTDLNIADFRSAYPKHAFSMALYSLSFGILGILVLSNIFIVIVADAMSFAKRDLRMNRAQSVPESFARGVMSRVRFLTQKISNNQNDDADPASAEKKINRRISQYSRQHRLPCCIHLDVVRRLVAEKDACEICSSEIPPGTPPGDEGGHVGPSAIALNGIPVPAFKLKSGTCDDDDEEYGDHDRDDTEVTAIGAC